MNKVLLTCLLACLSCFAHAQSTFWVMFTDKGEDPQLQLDQAAQYFSPQAQALRAEKGIAYSYSDLPVSQNYLSRVSAMNVELLSTSKWLNAVAVKGSSASMEALLALDFVDEVRPCATFVNHAYYEESMEETLEAINSVEYGKAFRQAEMLNVPPFHEAGYLGKGIRIAVFDAGFPGVNEGDAFKPIYDDGRLIATYDFVDKEENVYHASSHGTHVLSTIGANLPGQIVGTAPAASFILCRTEDASSETQVEEYNFLAAVEWADSVGVDIIHASLGYTTFDGDIGSYTYEDLDGDKAIVTRAVDLAASKGILVTVSAGNEGSGSWHYIAAPCDGDSVLCVGSVDKYLKRSSFSSFGPTADGRIKPDVVALGSRATVFAPSNRVSYQYGTSFSGPIMAGFMACLKQANPEATNMELIWAARLSGDQAGLPDNEYGYGVPNLTKADSLLKTGKDLSKVKIVQAEKPLRGRQASKPTVASVIEIVEPEFTRNPKTMITKSPKKLKIKVPAGVKIENLSIKPAGSKKPVMELNSAKGAKKAVFKTAGVNSGKYVLEIKTTEYKEKISLTL